jgi:hypothetical protein
MYMIIMMPMLYLFLICMSVCLMLGSLHLCINVLLLCVSVYLMLGDSLKINV